MRRSVYGHNDEWFWALLDDLADIPTVRPNEINLAISHRVVKRGNARWGENPRELRTSWPLPTQNELEALRMLATGWSWLDLTVLFGGKNKLDSKFRTVRFKLRSYTLEHAIAIALRNDLLDLEPIREFRVGVSRKGERVGFHVSNRTAKPHKLTLSKRRKEVLLQLASGLTVQQIAQKEGDPNGRRTTAVIRTCKQALGAITRYEAVANAIRMGLLFDEEEQSVSDSGSNAHSRPDEGLRHVV